MEAVDCACEVVPYWFFGKSSTLSPATKSGLLHFDLTHGVNAFSSTSLP